LNYRYIFAFQYNRVDKVRGPLTKSNCPITRDWRSSNLPATFNLGANDPFSYFGRITEMPFRKKNWTVWYDYMRGKQ